MSRNIVMDDFLYGSDELFTHAPASGNTYYRTSMGVGRIFIRDINNPGNDNVSDSRIPVMFDSVSNRGKIEMNHLPLGGNVLYLDGHVESSMLAEWISTGWSDYFWSMIPPASKW